MGERKKREEEKEKRKEYKAKRKNVKQFKEASEEDSCLLVSRDGPDQDSSTPAASKLPKNAHQMWTDEDLIELSRLIKKIPGGSAERWERIAELLGRTPQEVTKMAANIKKNPSIVPITSKSQGVTGNESKKLISDECLENHDQEDYNDEDEESDVDSDDESDEVDEDGYLVLQPAKVEEYVPPEEKKKTKTKGGKQKVDECDEALEDDWNQDQQRSLEQALVAFPKGTSERWDRIASKVEGKTKEQCMARFRVLAEQV